jgi:hypothetical protein
MKLGENIDRGRRLGGFKAQVAHVRMRDELKAANVLTVLSRCALHIPTDLHAASGDIRGPILAKLSGVL